MRTQIQMLSSSGVLEYQMLKLAQTGTSPTSKRDIRNSLIQCNIINYNMKLIMAKDFSFECSCYIILCSIQWFQKCEVLINLNIKNWEEFNIYLVNNFRFVVLYTIILAYNEKIIELNFIPSEFIKLTKTIKFSTLSIEIFHFEHRKNSRLKIRVNTIKVFTTIKICQTFFSYNYMQISSTNSLVYFINLKFLYTFHILDILSFHSYIRYSFIPY